MADKQEDPPILELVGFGAPLPVNGAVFATIREEFQVEDVSTLMPGMRGKGLKVAGLLELVSLPTKADHVTFSSSDGQYSVSLTLDQTKNYGILIYEVDGQFLPKGKGGPFRLVTPGLGDLCANVKNVGRMTITAGSGKDTRPVERSC